MKSLGKKTTLAAVFVFSMLVIWSFASAVPAHAATSIGRGYSDTEFRTLTQSFFNLYQGGNPSEAMLDEYAQMAYCDLYKAHYDDDFRWNQIREAIKGNLKAYGGNTQHKYELVGNLTLERYNFEKEFFPIEAESQLNNVGQLYLFSSPGYFNFCGRSGQLDVLPAYHLMSLFEPLNLTQVEIPADKAKQITPFMKNVGNGYKRLYARYRLHILDFEELKDSRNLEAVYKGQVEAIDFFLDEALTQPVHSINFTSGF